MKGLSKLNNRLLKLIVGLGICVGLTGCHKEHLDIDFRQEYKKLMAYDRLSDSFKTTIYNSNIDINTLINNTVNDELANRENIVINMNVANDTYSYDMSDNEVIDGVIVTYKNKKYLWDGNIKPLLSFYSNKVDYLGPTVLLSRHYEYEDELNKLKSDASNYVYAAQRPKYEFTGSGLNALDSGQKGQSADISTAVNEFNALMNEHKSGNITLALNEIDTDISTEQLNEVNKKLSTFTTYFANSVNRGGNIRVAASRVNGTLLAPGEEISVDKLFKSRNKANGYFKAGSYLNGETVQTYGGGICQVSTTLYGAILRAGLIPTERNAHSMSVSYVPLGLDAAVSEGYKDLKIKNTYTEPIYIQAVIDSTSLTFNIWGNSSLLGGYTYRPRSKSSDNGLRAESWLQKLDSNGNVVSEQHLFKSNYRPHS